MCCCAVHDSISHDRDRRLCLKCRLDFCQVTTVIDPTLFYVTFPYGLTPVNDLLDRTHLPRDCDVMMDDEGRPLERHSDPGEYLERLNAPNRVLRFVKSQLIRANSINVVYWRMEGRGKEGEEQYLFFASFLKAFLALSQDSSGFNVVSSQRFTDFPFARLQVQSEMQTSTSACCNNSATRCGE